MDQALYFTAAGIGVFIISDAILGRLEDMAGRSLPYRSLIFFALMFGLGTVAFKVIQGLLTG